MFINRNCTKSENTSIAVWVAFVRSSKEIEAKLEDASITVWLALVNQSNELATKSESASITF
jgi:hypothetical protein